jgi:uncharacterized protein involved in exopolysaccharide biosynthesis
MELSLEPRELLRVFRRRFWWFVLPAALIGLIAVAAIALTPPVYRSEATILVESQDIPEDLVPSLITDYVDRRLDVLTRRVTLTDNLLELVERYDLYPELQETLSRSELAERMRENIVMEVISTEINDPNTGRSSESTVAFSIQFDYKNQQDARRVVDELVSLYLSLNVESRRQLAEQATSFFTDERERLDERIANLERELATFQTANRELLPEEAAFKRQLLANLEQRLQNLQSSFQSLREREGFLETQLALTDEYESNDLRGRLGTTPETQLELSRAELATARARYSDSHPDVVRLEREVRSLEAVTGARAGTGAALAEREAALAAELGALRQRYTADHPDVRRVQRELAAVRASFADAAGGGAPAAERNDAYIQLSAQLNSVRAEIRAVENQLAAIEEERLALMEQLARAPAVEREYAGLVRNLESAVAQRDQLSEKETTASLSGSLETQAISERLTLAEPATLPREPISPNVTLILALGIVLAGGGGGMSMVAAEFLDRSVRSTAQLARLVGDTPLAAIPTLVSPRERRRLWIRRGAIAVVVVVLVAAGLVWFDRQVRPLSVLGYQVQATVAEWFAATFAGASEEPGG